MLRSNNRRRFREEDTEINIVPIMNMFMVLIPFLLMSASFFQIRAINTSVPIHSSSPPSVEATAQKPTHKITVILELNESQVRLSALSDTLDSETLAKLETRFKRTSAQSLRVASIADHLKKLKDQYPLSDTLLLIPADNVPYRDIIQAMDCARQYNDLAMFPNVVLTASLG